MDPAPQTTARRSPLDGDAEDLRAVRSALSGLRQEIRTRFPADAIAQEAGTRGLEDSFLELRRRLATLGMRERTAEIDPFGMDADALRTAGPLLDFLHDRYWRVDTGGIEHLPQGPVLLVANRSGLLPYDALMICQAIERAGAARVRARFTVADWLWSLPFAQPRFASLGGVRACPENVERLLALGHPVCVFPEGAKGATKPYRERYRLQRFGRGGVIRLALASGVPLVPVGVVGAEEAHPILWKAQAPARALGLPFLPVTPTFPLLGPAGLLPLPSRWVLRFGEPVAFDGLPQDAARDELLLSRLTEELRARIQELVDAGLRSRESVWA